MSVEGIWWVIPALWTGWNVMMAWMDRHIDDYTDWFTETLIWGVGMAGIMGARFLP